MSDNKDKVIKALKLEILILKSKLKTSEKKVDLSKAALLKIEDDLERFGMKIDETQMGIQNTNNKLLKENKKLGGKVKRLEGKA